MKANSQRKSSVAPHARLSVSPPTNYSFAERLEEMAVLSEGRKGERTKARLVASTAQLLESHGLRGLTHTHVCEAADINVATFYQYFDNKTAIVAHVIELFLVFITECDDPSWRAPMERARKTTDPYGTFYASNLHFLRLSAANPGMYRCVLQFGAERDDIARRWQEFSAGFYSRSARRVARAAPDASLDDLRLKATLLGGMMDDFCRNFFVFRAGNFTHPWSDRFATDKELAAFLSDMWYQIMMDAPPPPSRQEWIDSFE